MVKHNPFQSRATFEVDGKTYHYYDLKALENAGVGNVSQLPYSVKVLLESVLRQVDGRVITERACYKFSEMGNERCARYRCSI